MTGRSRLTLLIIIILAGFLLRYAGLNWGQGYRYFAIGDEINAYRVAMDYLAGNEQATYLGQPDFSGGRVPGPLWALFWALPLKWGASPEGVIFLMILLNTAVIPLVYLLAGRLLGPGHALWAALFYAFAPWTVYYSVGAWNPLPMAFLGALLYLALWDVTRRSGSRQIFFVCLILAVMPHFHMISVFVAPAVLLVLVLSPVRISRKWLILGIVAGIGVYIPYLAGEMSHQWSNTRAMLGGGWKFSFGVLRIFSTPVDVLSNLVSRWTGYRFEEYRAFGNFLLGHFFVLLFFNAVALFYSVLYIGRFLVDLFAAFKGRWLNPREAFRIAPATVFMGILLLVPPLLFIITGHGYNSRYAIVQFPLLFLLPSLFIAGLNRKRRHLWIGGIAALMIFNVVLILGFFIYQGRFIDKGEYFMASFRKMETVHRILKAHAGTERPVKIDAGAYLASANEEAARGVTALGDFIGVRERFAGHINGGLPESVYRVFPLEKDIAGRGEIFSSNGIVLVPAVP